MGKYLELFTQLASEEDITGLEGGAKVMLDGTPRSLIGKFAAPRVKRLVPQARFVIVLRVLLFRSDGAVVPFK